MCEQQVGERVGQLRRQRRQTRAEFGDMIGVSERNAGRIERGTFALSCAMIAKICEITGVSADYLIFGIEDPLSAAAMLKGLSRAQIQVVLEIATQVIQFISTENGNNALIQEALRRQKMPYN